MHFRGRGHHPPDALTRSRLVREIVTWDVSPTVSGYTSAAVLFDVRLSGDDVDLADFRIMKLLRWFGLRILPWAFD